MLTVKFTIKKTLVLGNHTRTHTKWYTRYTRIFSFWVSSKRNVS